MSYRRTEDQEQEPRTWRIQVEARKETHLVGWVQVTARSLEEARRTAVAVVQEQGEEFDWDHEEAPELSQYEVLEVEEVQDE